MIDSIFKNKIESSRKQIETFFMKRAQFSYLCNLVEQNVRNKKGII